MTRKLFIIEKKLFEINAAFNIYLQTYELTGLYGKKNETER